MGVSLCILHSQREYGKDGYAPGGNARLAGEYDSLLHTDGSIWKVATRFSPTRCRRSRNQHRSIEKFARGRARKRFVGGTCIAYAFDKALCQPMVTIVGYQ